MKRFLLVCLLGAAFVAGVSSAAGPVPDGPYVFIPGQPGSGNSNQPFTVNGFNIVGSPGASVTGVDACAGVHVHGAFFGTGDPGGACGHGIITAFGGGAIPGASSLLPGSVPGSAAGQLALTRPGIDASTAGELFLYAFGAATGAVPSLAGLQHARDVLAEGDRNIPGRFIQTRTSSGTTSGGRGRGDTQIDLVPLEGWADMKIFTGFRDRGSKSPPVAGANPPVGASEDSRPADFLGPLVPLEPVLIGRRVDEAGKPVPADAVTDGKPAGSVLDTLQEPTLREVANAGSAPKPAPTVPDPEAEKAIDKAAQGAMDAIFSGDSAKADAAKKNLAAATPEVRNRVERKINERVQKIIGDAMRASTSAAAGVPRVAN